MAAPARRPSGKRALGHASALHGRSKPCLLSFFIDEIDGIPSRENADQDNRGWWDQIINALIEGIDHIRKNEKRVIVIGACNRAERIIRPGANAFGSP